MLFIYVHVVERSNKIYRISAWSAYAVCQSIVIHANPIADEEAQQWVGLLMYTPDKRADVARV